MTATPALLGARRDGRPIWAHAGADDGSSWVTFDSDSSDEDQADESDDDYADDDYADGGWQAPTREEWDRQQAAIRRNNSENKKHRLLKKALSTHGIDLDSDDGISALTDALAARRDSSADDGDGTSRREVDKASARAAERATAKAEARYKPAVAQLAVKAALHDAGFTGNNPGRLMRLIDLDEVDVDPDGNVTGIAEQIDDLKKDFPEWFRGQKSGDSGPRKGAAEVDGGDKKTKTGGTPGWLQQIDQRLS